MARLTLSTAAMVAAMLTSAAAAAQERDTGALPCNALCRSWMGLDDAQPAAQQAARPLAVDLHPTLPPPPQIDGAARPRKAAVVARPAPSSVRASVRPAGSPVRVVQGAPKHTPTPPRPAAPAIPVPSIVALPQAPALLPARVTLATLPPEPAIEVPPPLDPALDPALVERRDHPAAVVPPEPAKAAPLPPMASVHRPVYVAQAPVPTPAPVVAAAAATPAPAAKPSTPWLDGLPPPFDVIAAVMLAAPLRTEQADSRAAVVK